MMVTPVPNIYFELTEAFNRSGPIAALASGQAVVFYRIAIVSKDGDWIAERWLPHTVQEGDRADAE